MRQKFVRLEGGLEINFADSKAYSTIKKDWLQGGILNLISCKIPLLLNKDDIKINDIGR